MKSEVLAHTDWLTFPLVAVVLFVVVFIAMVLWVSRPGAKEFYAARGRMLLEDQEDTHARR